MVVTGCAGVGFGAMRAGGFLPVEAAVGHKTVPGAYFRDRGACTQYPRGGGDRVGQSFCCRSPRKSTHATILAPPFILQPAPLSEI